MEKNSRGKQLAKNTAILTVGKICTQCVSFFLLPLYTALLDPSEYGIVDIFSTYAAFILPLCNWQMDMGLFRFMLDVRNNRQKQKMMVSTVMNTNHFQAVAFMLLFLILQFFSESQYKVFLALEVVLNLYMATLLQVARGIKRTDVYSIASFLSASLSVILNVLFIAVLRMGALGMFCGMIIGKFVTDIYLLIATKFWRFYSVRQFDRKFMKEIIRYSLPLVPNQIAWWVVGASDRTVITKVLGVAQNGIYSIAYKFPSMYITFYNIFNLAWTESCALHINDDDSDQYLSSVITTMFSLFSSICLGILSVMPFAFPVFINEKYSAAYVQIPILLIAVLFQSVVGLISVVYTAKKLSAVLAKTSFWIAAINLVTNLLLIKSIGLYAASLSACLAYAVMMIYRYLDVQKYVKIRIPLLKVIRAGLFVGFVGATYYSSDYILHVFALIATVVYAIVENRELLLAVLRNAKMRCRK